MSQTVYSPEFGAPKNHGANNGAFDPSKFIAKAANILLAATRATKVFVRRSSRTTLAPSGPQGTNASKKLYDETFGAL